MFSHTWERKKNEQLQTCVLHVLFFVQCIIQLCQLCSCFNIYPQRGHEKKTFGVIKDE